TATPSGYSPMVNAPMVAMPIKKNSEKISPFLILFTASVNTGNPTGAYATTYQIILTQPVNHCCGNQLSNVMATSNNTNDMIHGKDILIGLLSLWLWSRPSSSLCSC